MVTGANQAPHTVPEFLTGRPMQSQEPLQHPADTHSESQDPTHPTGLSYRTIEHHYRSHQ